VCRYVCDAGPIRLDLFLSRRIPGVGRRAARRLCGLLSVFRCGAELSGDALRGGALKLMPGDELRFPSGYLPEPVSARVIGGLDLSSLLVFEDDSLLLFDKPRCMHSVPLSPLSDPTLADYSVTISPGCCWASYDPRDGGLLHRLDYYTSGFLIAAKNRDVWESMRRELFSGAIEKGYSALVDGVVCDGGYVSSPIYPGDSTSCRTDYRPVELIKSEVGQGSATLLEIDCALAKRHQIRRHMAEIGHPLVGDSRYGSLTSISDYLQELEDGFFLRADLITFSHPLSSERMSFELKF